MDRIQGADPVDGARRDRTSLVDPPDAKREAPRAELVHRVTGSTDVDAFLAQGWQSGRDLEVALSSIGRCLDDFTRALDFGCGSGRVLLWLQQLARRVELHGSDIDAEAIRWASQNIGWASFTCNGVEPPLDFPDAHFDLVVSHSVFTHVDEAYQDRWLAELRRVTRPGGVLVLSVHGEHAFRGCIEDMTRVGQDPSEIVDVMNSQGMVFIAEDDQIGGPFPDHYHVSFHAPWYVFTHWGRMFEVLAYLPRRGLGFQDYVVLERPTGAAPLPEGAVGRPPTDRPSFAAPKAARVDDPAIAVHRLASLLESESTDGLGGRLNRVAGMLTRRLLGPERRRRAAVDAAVLAALQALTAPRDPSRAEHLTRVAIQRQGERIGRLESDLWAAIRQLETTSGEPSIRGRAGRTT